MSYNDQKDFLSDICPFCELDDNGLDIAIAGIEIGFYPNGTQLLDIDASAEILYMIIKGEVKAFDSSGDLLRVYHAKESFDTDALLEGKATARYEVTEDLICYELSRKAFMKLFEEYEPFKKFFLMDMVERVTYLKKQERSSELSSFMIAKVKDAYLHKPCIVDKSDMLSEALKKSVEMKSSSIVVRNDSQYRIVTDSDIKKALSEGRIDLNGPISSLASFPLISAKYDDFLFNVYLQLIQKDIKRIAIFKDENLVGMLEQIDVLSYFANHSHLVTVKIERSKSIDELRDASLDYLNIVRKLYAQGVKVRYIAKLVSEINRKIFLRLFEMVFPDELKSDCALMVMGSEGRGEQIIRTDQDNGLIIRDGVDVEQYRQYVERLSEILIGFGYPPCPGNIMVSNPSWCKNESEYRKQISHWLITPEEESFMEFSIFFDAQCVAGDADLLYGLKEYLLGSFDVGDDVYMGYFAKLTTLFETPVGFFSTFLHKDRRIDLKKAGIFPIVQGVRSLSLHYDIKELSTAERIKKLNNKGVLEESFAKELIEALDIFMYLRLSRQLYAIDKGEEPNNMIITDDLSKIQRDLLKDSLQIAEKFKKFIMRHFEFEYLG